MPVAFDKMNLRAEKLSATARTPVAAPARDRVLEVACEMFAEAGFHGTHFREICKRTGTNVAGVCYHFGSKEGLYEAVSMEAGRRLSEANEGFGAPTHSDPQEKLFNLIDSLLKRLSEGRAWIAKLLARELVDQAGSSHSYAASRLERDFVLLQGAMRELLRTRADEQAVRLHALSIIGECVFYSLAEENPRHPLAQLAVAFADRTKLAQFIARRALGALESDRNKPEFSNKQ